MKKNRQKNQSPEAQELIRSAAEATENFSEDVLEEHSRKLRAAPKKKPAKGQSLEDFFHGIAEDAIKVAEEVDCPMEDFLEGLRTMESALRARREIEG